MSMQILKDTGMLMLPSPLIWQKYMATRIQLLPITLTSQQ